MKNNVFNRMCRSYRVNINELNARFHIPLRTLKAWRYGERKPPDYVLYMLEQLINDRFTHEKEAPNGK